MPRIKKQWVQATVENCVIGIPIRIKQSVGMPRHDFGPYVTHASIGKFVRMSTFDSCKIDFPEHQYWNGWLPDMEVYVGGKNATNKESQ